MNLHEIVGNFSSWRKKNLGIADQAKLKSFSSTGKLFSCVKSSFLILDTKQDFLIKSFSFLLLFLNVSWHRFGNGLYGDDWDGGSKENIWPMNLITVWCSELLPSSSMLLMMMFSSSNSIHHSSSQSMSHYELAHCSSRT